MTKIALRYAIALAIFAGISYAVAGPEPSVGIYWYDNTDPTFPPGMSAPLNQLLVRTDAPSLYYKSSTAATGWTKIGSGTSSGGTVTSVACGVGLSCAPSPITSAGTISVALTPTSCAPSSAVTGIASNGTGSCTPFTPAGSISGTTNTLAKFASSSTVGNSSATDDGTTFAINGTEFTVTEASGNFAASGTGSIGGALNMNSHLIDNVTNPVSAQDAATKNYVDSSTSGAVNGTTNFVSKFTGAHAVGNSSVSDDGTTWALGSVFSIVEASGNFSSSGTGSIGGALNMNSHLIDNVTNPVSAQDAATKSYVDSSTSGAVSGTTNTVTKFTGSHAVGNSNATDDGSTFAVSEALSATGTCTLGDASHDTTVGRNLFINGGFLATAPSTVEDTLIVHNSTGIISITSSLDSYAGNPNGIVSANVGSIVMDGTDGLLFLNINGGTAWVQLAMANNTVFSATEFGQGFDNSGIFDGSATVFGISPSGSTYTLTRDLQATSITVNSGVTVAMNGWRIFANQKLTNNGHITFNGANGANGSGTTGGAGGAGIGANHYYATNFGGGNGGNASASGQQASSSNNFPVPYITANVATTSASSNGARGQGGGGGISGQGQGGGGGGAQTYVGTAGQTGWLEWYTSATAYNGTKTAVTPCTGGGGGGGAASSSGGGGGAAGGFLFVSARVLAGNGTFESKGGTGGNGAGTNAGAGGGGAGCFIILTYVTNQGTWTDSESGAAGGSGVGTGGGGGSGGSGYLVKYNLSNDGT